MINKIINIALNVIIFIIPLLIIPIGIEALPYNLLKISALISCGIILLIALIFKRKELKFDKVDKILIVFYVLIILSTIFSIRIKNSIIGRPNRYEGLLAFTVYFLTYYCSKYYFEQHKFINTFSITVVWTCSIIGILQYYNIFPLYKMFNIPYTPGFVSSTFGNPNFFGSFLAIAVTVCMALYIIKKQKIYLITSFISFFAMITTMTRSAWVGLGFASIFGIIYIIKNRNKDIIKRMIHIIIGFIIIFIFVLKPPQFITNFLHSISNTSDKSTELTNLDSFGIRLKLMNSELKSAIVNKDVKDSFGSNRIRIWKIVFKTVTKVPLLGSGPDTLAESLFYNANSDAVNYFKTYGCYIDKAHNEYLQIAATIGIPALIVYLLFLIQIFIKQRNLFKNNSTFILIIPIIAYLVQAFFNISTIGVAPIFWFLLGLLQNEKFKEKIL